MKTIRIYTLVILVLSLSGVMFSRDCPDPPNEGSGSGGSATTQSCDPNEKAGPAGAGDPATQRFVNPGEELPYIIYFENKSDATASAQEVRITDKLSEHLDWSTFKLGEVVFANQTVEELTGKVNATTEVSQTTGTLRVRIQGGIDQQTGIASWYLRCVDPSTSDGWPENPYHGFLLPNDETHRGEGYVAFTIRTKSDAAAQTRITNESTIIFDYNEPITTNQVFNTIAGNVPGEPTNPSPCDGCKIPKQFFLGWDYASLAQSYSVYFWKQGESKPTSPIASSLKSAFCDISSISLEEGETYFWQVHAVNFMGETQGPVWSFKSGASSISLWMIY